MVVKPHDFPEDNRQTRRVGDERVKPEGQPLTPRRIAQKSLDPSATGKVLARGGLTFIIGQMFGAGSRPAEQASDGAGTKMASRKRLLLLKPDDAHPASRLCELLRRGVDPVQGDRPQRSSCPEPGVSRVNLLSLRHQGPEQRSRRLLKLF